MTAQHAAMAVAAIEDCIDRYIAGCHARVDEFVERHFSLQETIALQKQSFVGDLLCHPVNTLWAIPYLLLKKVVEVPEKLGWHAGADLVGLLPSGIKTRYQKKIERLIVTELLAWPCEGGTGLTVPHGLAEMLKRDRSVVPLVASEAERRGGTEGAARHHESARIPFIQPRAGVRYGGDGLDAVDGMDVVRRSLPRHCRDRRSDREKGGSRSGGGALRAGRGPRVRVLLRVPAQAVGVAGGVGHAVCRALCHMHEPAGGDVQ